MPRSRTDRTTSRGLRLAVGSLVLGCNGPPILPEDRFDTQPLQDQASGISLVADLRLDNREELFERLGLPAESLHTRPDSWFLLQAWLRWGEACPEHLLGDFAAAIWDERAQTLTLIRDHMGQRPLFYHDGPELFAFASSLRAMLSARDVPRRLAPRVVTGFLANGQAALRGDTLYEGISMLPAASTLTVRRSGPANLRRYWRPQPDPAMIGRSPGDYEEAYRAVLGQAVRDRLRCLGTPALMLSGGFDSAAIAALSAPHKLIAVTHVPSDPARAPGNDRARDWTSHCRDFMPHLDLHHIETGGTLMLEGLPQAIARTGLPPMTDHYAYDALLKMAASAGARVIMTGDGGDFTLNHRGNGFLAWLLASGRLGSFIREFGAHRRRTGDSAWSTLRIQVLRPLMPYWIWQAWRRARGTAPPPYRRMTVGAEAVRQLEASGAPFRWRDDRPLLPGPDFLARRNLALDRWMNAPMVHLADQARDYGMAVTCPYLDRRVVELSLALPHDLVVCDGWNRALARKALAAVLPPRYQTRDRSNADGVAVDAFQIHRTALADLHAEAKRLRRSGACPEIDFDGLDRLLDTPADAPYADDMLFHALRVIAVGRFLQWFRAPNR